MIWQDSVLTGGTIIFIVALIPSVLGKDKPAVSTSLPTACVLTVFVVVYASLSLWFAAIANSFTATLWFILALQKWKEKASGANQLLDKAKEA